MTGTPSPAELTARAEPTANRMSGTFGGVCQTCTGPRQVRFQYDDPYKTPATAVLTRFLQNGSVLKECRSYHAMNYSGQCSSASLPPIRAQLGIAEQADLPYTPIDIDTGDAATLKAAEQEAWQLEQQIVADLNAFEQTMAGAFAPYVTDWQNDGWLGAGGDFVSGIGSGLSSWWSGEKDFWGSAWGYLKSSTAAVGGVLYDAGAATWDAVSDPVGTARAAARVTREAIDAGVDMVAALSDFLRGLLSGDVDKLYAALEPLAFLKNVEGAIGEFGALMEDLFQRGSEFLNGLLEVFRRTPVLGLIANSLMRVITLMTPNFWAELIGKGVGFVLPELVMWAITTIISALLAATGVGAAGAVGLVAARVASLASKLRSLIKGAGTGFGLLVRFMDLFAPIMARLGPLGQALRKSIRYSARRNIDRTKVAVLPMRHWIDRLAELARQGHGPGRHEGAVTDAQLINRSLHGFDPMTNSPVDYDKFFKKYGVHYDPIAHGTPPNFGGRKINVPGKGDLKLEMSGKIRHIAGEHATKFNTPEDYVRAYDWVVKDPRFKAFEVNGDTYLPIEDINMSDIFGSNFQSRVKGYDENGKPTVFGASTKLIARFTKDAQGNPQLLTMFPDP